MYVHAYCMVSVEKKSERRNERLIESLNWIVMTSLPSNILHSITQMSFQHIIFGIRLPIGLSFGLSRLLLLSNPYIHKSIDPLREKKTCTNISLCNMHIQAYCNFCQLNAWPLLVMHVHGLVGEFVVYSLFICLMSDDDWH